MRTNSLYYIAKNILIFCIILRFINLSLQRALITTKQSAKNEPYFL